MQRLDGSSKAFQRSSAEPDRASDGTGRGDVQAAALVQAAVFRARRMANETLGFLQLWRKSIQKVEGKHGADLGIRRPLSMLSTDCSMTLDSSVQCPGLSTVHEHAGSNIATTLCLIRFAFVMNLLLLLLWLLLVVLPFWVKPPVTFRWGQLTAYSAKSVVQGHGLDNTFLLYGVVASRNFSCCRRHAPACYRHRERGCWPNGLGMGCRRLQLHLQPPGARRPCTWHPKPPAAHTSGPWIPDSHRGHADLLAAATTAHNRQPPKGGAPANIKEHMVHSFHY
jgi:hypothetical protein